MHNHSWLCEILAILLSCMISLELLTVLLSSLTSYCPMTSVLEILLFSIIGSDPLLQHFSVACVVLRYVSPEDVGVMSCETMLHRNQTTLLHIPEDRIKIFS
jgi:hypothetical protein